ncbi:hypothetical protein BB483_03340 [Helicobacter pylori]|nr:hypothetical protein BB483_03340 [Helicobacter pylori]
MIKILRVKKTNGSFAFVVVSGSQATNSPKTPLNSLSKNKCFKSSTLTMYKPFYALGCFSALNGFYGRISKRV